MDYPRRAIDGSCSQIGGKHERSIQCSGDGVIAGQWLLPQLHWETDADRVAVLPGSSDGQIGSGSASASIGRPLIFTCAPSVVQFGCAGGSRRRWPCRLDSQRPFLARAGTVRLLNNEAFRRCIQSG